jgi:hypothetical protein
MDHNHHRPDSTTRLNNFLRQIAKRKLARVAKAAMARIVTRYQTDIFGMDPDSPVRNVFQYPSQSQQHRAINYGALCTNSIPLLSICRSTFSFRHAASAPTPIPVPQPPIVYAVVSGKSGGFMVWVTTHHSIPLHCHVEIQFPFHHSFLD